MGHCATISGISQLKEKRKKTMVEEQYAQDQLEIPVASHHPFIILKLEVSVISSPEFGHNKSSTLIPMLRFIFLLSCVSLIVISCNESSTEGRPPLKKRVAERVALEFVRDYARAEGLEPQLFAHAVVAEACKCLDPQRSETADCMTEVSPRFLNDANAWQFEYRYEGSPGHQIGFLVGQNGVTAFNSDRAPKNFGRTGFRIDGRKYRRLVNQE